MNGRPQITSTKLQTSSNPQTEKRRCVQTRGGQEMITENQDQRRPYDLEERTFEFARQVRALVKVLPRTLCNIEDAKQLVRSSGSVGANYIEANEAASKKDFVHRIKICRKEAKESRYWLRLLHVEASSKADEERNRLAGEATELLRIFSAMLRRSDDGGRRA